MTTTYNIHITGIVQGVGFRPFVYRTAQELKLTGSVCNDTEGVSIFINATQAQQEAFVSAIQTGKPAIAHIEAIQVEGISQKQFEDFQIIESSFTSNLKLPLTPDYATCPICRTEISDPTNRRYNYAFTTCTNCGPRYAITTQFPFERKHTSMASFEMCNDCLEEYQNPEDRRFHSQTNSCTSCGIQLEFVTDEKIVSKNSAEALQEAVQLLSFGKILAVKNTNGYLLCCDATKAEAIHNLRKRKRRPSKPFAVMFRSISAIEQQYDLSSKEIELLTSAVAPVVLLQNTSDKQSRLSLEAIAPRLSQTGVMLPSSALLQLLADSCDFPLITTSGNIHGSPIIYANEDAHKLLQEVADGFLEHNLETRFPQDDSVYKVEGEDAVIFRRSRGLAPNLLASQLHFDKVFLAMGAHLKSTFAFTPNTYTYESQYFGNLDNYEVLERFRNTLKQYHEVFNTKPETILIDKHPGYQSSIEGKELAARLEIPYFEIQHHKAHFASVLGEHNLIDHNEPILGVVWDGTGLGDDGAIWGGEFFIYEHRKISRYNHFEYFDWLAQDKMSREPRLCLLAALGATDEEILQQKFSKTELQIYEKLLQSNTLKTSSVGRLFDAVASVLDLCDKTTYEGEAAMLLESLATQYSGDEPINFLESEDFEKIPSQKLIKRIYKAKIAGVFAEKLAYSFIYTLSEIIVQTALKIQVKTIACSGGVFQNTLLLKLLKHSLNLHNLNLKINCNLSVNDENIAFGQLVYHTYIDKN